MIRRLAFAALSLVVVLALSAPAPAQQSFTVGVEELDYLPHYSWDATAPKGQEYQGYAREVLDAFAQAKGYSFTYVAYPVARLFDEFLTKQSVDFKYPDNPYWSAEAKKAVPVVYSDPVVAYIDGVMVTPARKGQPAASLKTLGTIRGFTAFEFLDAVKAGQVTLDESTDYQALLKKCALGRVDGAYSNVAVANWNLQEKLKQPGALVFDANLPHTKSHYLLSTIKRPKIVEEFNAWLKENKAQVDAIKAKRHVEAMQ